MKRCFALAVLLATLSGCKMKEFASTPFYMGDEVKYSGRAEDRINIWPLAYWREPVGSVLWPMVSYGNDHFTLRPLYSQYRQNGKDGAFDEFNFLWPFCQADLKGDEYRIFPVFWGGNAQDHGYQIVFPLYWNGPEYNSLFPLWFYGDSCDKSHLSVVFGMAGASSENGGHRANWCFPLWYWNDRGTFMTTIYGRWKNGWAIPPLLSWGESGTNGDYSAYCMLGLGGEKKAGNDIKHWAFPFYNRENLMCCDSNRYCKTHMLMGFVGWESKDNELCSSYAFPLYAWEKDCRLLTPLFHWNKEGSLLTPLGGRTVRGGTTNLFVTPFVKCTTGSKTGGMVFPIWNGETDRGFREKAEMLESGRLPTDIRVWMESTTNIVWDGENRCDKPVETRRRCASRVSVRDDVDWLLLFPWHDRVQGHLGYCSRTNTYELARTIERGNGLLLKYGYERTVAFSAIDRSRESDEEKVYVSFLIWLYTYAKDVYSQTNGFQTRHRVLWKLWDWEEKDGNVSLDVFPGFTYDSKTNGYTKASFLWRLFRYENDPQAGLSVDVLFLPVWR